MKRARRIQLLACAAVLLTTGCGDTLEPGEIPDVTGMWDLSMESIPGYLHVCFVRGVTVELSQSPSTRLEGVWDLAGTTVGGEAGCSAASIFPRLDGKTILLKPGRVERGIVGSSEGLEGKGQWNLDLEIAVDDVEVINEETGQFERQFEARVTGATSRRSEFTGSGTMVVEGSRVREMRFRLSRH
jgi:hypothetical protein